MAPPPPIGSLRRSYCQAVAPEGTREQMTVPMSVQENIRTLDSHGIAGREIARRLGVSRDAVTKYTGQQDYSPRPPAPVPRPAGSVLTGFEHTIELWLGEGPASAA